MKELIVVGIIILLVGMNVPSTGINVEKSSTTSYDGNTLYVGGNGPGNYTKIQDAIDNASDGDIVFVYDNLSPYYEHVKVDKSINLVGENKNTTIIDGTMHDKIGVVWLYENGVKITGFTIQNGGGEAGINVWSNENIITGNIITNNPNDGIRIYGDNNLISKNTIKGNTGFGIQLYDSLYNSILNNVFESYDSIHITSMYYGSYWTSHTIEGNTVGSKPIRYYKKMNKVVFQEDTAELILAYCNDCIIQNLSIHNVDIGIQIAFSPNTTIRSNKIMDTSYAGLSLVYSKYNNVSDNIISDNKGDGIQVIGHSLNNYIFRNNITNNGFGIYFWESGSNYIYHNNFLNNNYNAVVGYFAAPHSNYWDNGSVGNYWDDYNGIDLNGDGIGDIPSNYQVSKYNNDYHPLMKPWPKPYTHEVSKEVIPLELRYQQIIDKIRSINIQKFLSDIDAAVDTLEEISTILEENDDLRLYAQMQSGCGCERTIKWPYPVMCLLLVPFLYISLYLYLAADIPFFIDIMFTIGKSLNCFWT